VFAVKLGVVPARFGMMLLGVAGMTVGAVRVMRRFLVIARFMMLGRFAMVLRCVLVMFGRLVVMLNARVAAHVFSPGWFE
jgi:hypothetical protein